MKEIPFETDDKDILERIRCVPPFDALPDNYIRQAMRVASVRRYEAGEVLIEEGEFDNRVFFLIFGLLEILVKGNRVGSLRRLGDVFGEMGIIDGSPRSATISAVKTSLVITLDDTAIGSLGEVGKIFTQAVMYRIFAEVLAVRLRDANGEISRLKEEIAGLKG
ncbi:cyclic nucleotide-binding domain-containing protein [Pseudodesulfovibrio sp.]|uniref:cyclic nucleotide-binding domain-containing protein n=1 Tax=unclassified Pseudodesulfovibrio TaxID=2661612 RepID=UPI003B00066E